MSAGTIPVSHGPGRRRCRDRAGCGGAQRRVAGWSGSSLHARGGEVGDELATRIPAAAAAESSAASRPCTRIPAAAAAESSAASRPSTRIPSAAGRKERDAVGHGIDGGRRSCRRRGRRPLGCEDEHRRWGYRSTGMMRPRKSSGEVTGIHGVGNCWRGKGASGREESRERSSRGRGDKEEGRRVGDKNVRGQRGDGHRTGWRSRRPDGYSSPGARRGSGEGTEALRKTTVGPACQRGKAKWRSVSQAHTSDGKISRLGQGSVKWSTVKQALVKGAHGSEIYLLFLVLFNNFVFLVSTFYFFTIGSKLDGF